MTLPRRLSAVLLLLALAACSGLTARQEILLPALRMAWSGVRDNITTGINSGVLSGRLTTDTAANLDDARDATTKALDSGDYLRLAAVPWVPLAAEANAGIDHNVAIGVLGIGVGESLKERVRQFTLARETFLSRR